MTSASPHRFHRHPAAPWAELRDSARSPHCFRLHMHAEYSIGIVDAGRTVFHHAHGPQPVEAGGVVLIEPGAWHACNPDPGAPWSYRMLFVDADWLHAQLGVAALRFPGARSRMRTSPAWWMACAAPSMARPPPTAWPWAWSTCWTAVPSPQPCPCPAMRRPWPRAAAPACRTRCRPDRAVPGPGMRHERHALHPPLQAATGMTPGSYRLNLRINGARRLLATGRRCPMRPMPWALPTRPTCSAPSRPTMR